MVIDRDVFLKLSPHISYTCREIDAELTPHREREHVRHSGRIVPFVGKHTCVMVAKLEVVAHHRCIQPDMMAGERVRGLSALEAVTEVDVASIYAVIEMVGLSAPPRAHPVCPKREPVGQCDTDSYVGHTGKVVKHIGGQRNRWQAETGVAGHYRGGPIIFVNVIVVNVIFVNFIFASHATMVIFSRFLLNRPGVVLTFRRVTRCRRFLRQFFFYVIFFVTVWGG